MQSNTCLSAGVPVPVEDDRVLRALADPSRRLLLDRFYEKKGHTLGELCTGLAIACQSDSAPGTAGGLLSCSGRVARAALLQPNADPRDYQRWIRKFYSQAPLSGASLSQVSDPGFRGGQVEAYPREVRTTANCRGRRTHRLAKIVSAAALRSSRRLAGFPVPPRSMSSSAGGSGQLKIRARPAYMRHPKIVFLGSDPPIDDRLQSPEPGRPSSGLTAP